MSEGPGERVSSLQSHYQKDGDFSVTHPVWYYFNARFAPRLSHSNRSGIVVPWRTTDTTLSHSFKVFDDTNEWVSVTLFDEALGIQTHNGPTNGVVLVSADAKGETALIVLSDLHNDH